MRVAWPADEDARLAAVAALDWPESDADPGLDEIAGLAATFLGMPIAIISLTGKDRQIAIAGRGVGRVSAPRETTMCKHVIAEGAMFVVNDAAADPRVADCPFVTQPPYVRFYAGAPLWSEDGYCLGTFCVLDLKPRHDFSLVQRNALSSFARMAEQRLRAHTLRKRMETAEAARAAAEARTRNILGEAAGAFMACDRLALNLGGRVRAALTRAQRANVRGGGHVLENELNALSDLIGELLAVARLDRGGAAAPALSAPSALVRAIVADSAPQAAARGVTLDFIEGGTGVEMLCDTWRLEELIENLIADCAALSQVSLRISCGFEKSIQDGRSRFAMRFSSPCDGPPWRISARNRELVDCLAGCWELDQDGRRIAVHLPARLRTAEYDAETIAAPSNVIPFTRAQREGKL